MKRYTKPIHLPRQSRRPSEGGALALINVVFLLLMFLLVAGTLRPPMPAGFSWAETKAAQGQGDIREGLVLTQDGVLWSNGEVVEDENLDALVSSLAGLKGRIPLQVDRRTDVAVVSAFAEKFADAGVKQLTLLTIEADQP